MLLLIFSVSAIVVALAIDVAINFYFAAFLAASVTAAFYCSNSWVCVLLCCFADCFSHYCCFFLHSVLSLLMLFVLAVCFAMFVLPCLFWLGGAAALI